MVIMYVIMLYRLDKSRVNLDLGTLIYFYALFRRYGLDWTETEWWEIAKGRAVEDIGEVICHSFSYKSQRCIGKREYIVLLEEIGNFWR